MSMRRQVGEAKALLRAKMLQVRADHLLQLQLHQSKLQSQQHAVAEAVAMQHLERQKGQLLALLRCCFPGKMTDPQDPAPAYTASASFPEAAVAAGPAAKTAAGTAPAGPLVVAGYSSIGSEYCCLPLLRYLSLLGAAVYLPVCMPHGLRMQFRLYEPGETLKPGRFGIPVPSASRPHLSASPHLLLLPLVAWSRLGVRLGYGGGYYDATIAAIRAAAASTAPAENGRMPTAAATPGELLSRLQSTGSLSAAGAAAGVQDESAVTASDATATAGGWKGPLVCGLSFNCQELTTEALPHEDHDCLLDAVISERDLYICNPELARRMEQQQCVATRGHEVLNRLPSLPKGVP